jgi:hypothetical protein
MVLGEASCQYGTVWLEEAAPGLLGLAMFGWVCQAGDMKKQASDQSFHDRRYQERKRAEAARKAPKKKVAAEAGKQSSESRVRSSE